MWNAARRPGGGCHGSSCERWPPVARGDQPHEDAARAVRRSCAEGGSDTNPLTRCARMIDTVRGGRAGHEVSVSTGCGRARSRASVRIMCPSAQRGQARRETPVRDAYRSR